VILEEGGVSAAHAAAYRTRHAYSMSRMDALGKAHQTYTRLPENPDLYNVAGITYDSAGRPVKAPLPVTGGLGYDPNIVATANTFHNGTGGAPDAGGYAWSEIDYAAEPSLRVIRSAAPG